MTVGGRNPWRRRHAASGRRGAVRSSAAAEDLPDASYASLYETYLNVPADGLGEAVRRCFAAATAERVSAYHQRRHGDGTPRMAVLVQAMVDPITAGWHSPSIPSAATPRSGLSHRRARPG